jgi:calcium-dependent protein kinase
MAPELIHGGQYDAKCDVWSLGVLLYIFLSGYMPFPARTRDELFTKIERGKYTFDHKEFKVVSAEAIDLIK